VTGQDEQLQSVETLSQFLQVTECDYCHQKFAPGDTIVILKWGRYHRICGEIRENIQVACKAGEPCTPDCRAYGECEEG